MSITRLIFTLVAAAATGSGIHGETQLFKLFDKEDEGSLSASQSRKQNGLAQRRQNNGKNSIFDPEGKCGHARSLNSVFSAGGFPGFGDSYEALTDTDVLHYDLSIEAIPSAEEIIGSNLITADPLVADLTEFHFRLRDNYTITTLTLDGRPINFVRESVTTVRADFDRPYAEGETFELYVEYNGVAVSRGFGSIEFRTRSSGTPIVATLSEPWYAYTWWPAKDENGDKATIDISVTVPDTLIVAANGMLQGVDSLSGARSRYNYSHSYPVATYLVSFSATDYNTWTETFTHSGGSMPVDFFIYPQSDTGSNRTKWGKTIEMLDVFGELYGTYPFINEKYGIYQFEFGGGMEHQTITGQGGFGESLTAHELGHQWWGDMVTCETWHDIWLNEGFATYSVALWLENKAGSSGFPALQSYMQSSRPSNVNGSVYVYDISNPNTIFSSNFSYRKGAWVLHQLRHVIGDDAFYSTLLDYRTLYEYDSATTDDFIASAEAVYGDDLSWFFDKWVYGIGAPAYEWGWQSTTVNGKEYLLLHVDQTQSGSYGTYTMPIDIRATVTGDQETVKIWNDALSEHYVIPVASSASNVTLDDDKWILTTAISEIAYVPGPPKIVETSPAPDAIEVFNKEEVSVTFHTGVTAVSGDFSVVGNTTGNQPFSYSYDSGTNTAVLTFSTPLPADTYTLTVNDSVLAADSGQNLDGEIASPAALPSGDGGQGGAAVINFTCVDPVQVLPDNYNLYRGIRLSGSLPDLFSSDDSRLSVRAGPVLFPGESPIQVVVTGTAPSDSPSGLMFRVETSASTPGLQQTVELFNYDTATYETVGTWSMGTSDSSVEVIVTINPEQFVQSGTRTVQARIAIKQTGATLMWPWFVSIDELVWLIRT